MLNLFEMRSVINSGFLLIFSCMLPWGILAQVNTDCETAIVICSDDRISFKPQGRGIDDFANPNNSEGCLQELERISAWYYFEFRADMPPNSSIEFSIKALQGGNTDFDFAIYGADLNCDSLGMPLRCSFSDPNTYGVSGDTTGLRPYTLRRNALGQVIDTVYQTEFSEGFTTDALGRPADGFVAPMEVQPTQGFYLILDFFQRDIDLDTVDVIDFQLTWGGSAAPFLNCIANPRCVDAYTEAGPSQEVCAGDQALQLQGAAFNTNGGETYIWEGPGNTTAFLSDPNVLEPQVNIPAGFSGEILYKLRVEEGKCIKQDSVLLNVKAGPIPEIDGDTIFCPGETGVLRVTGGFDDYQWSDNETGATRTVSDPGEYRVSVSDGSGCPGIGLVTVENHPIPQPIITGERGFCPGGETTLSVGPSFQSFRWSNGDTDRSILVNTTGQYKVTVTTAEGCEAVDSFSVIEYPEPSPPIFGPTYLCERTTIELDAGNYLNYEWSGGQSSRSIEVDAPGTYSVTVTDENQCVGAGSKNISVRSNPLPTIGGEDLICSGAGTTLNAGLGFQGYLWSTGDSSRLLPVRSPGVYTVTVTDAFGCSGSDNFTLDTIASPRPQLMGDSTLCRGDSIFLDVGTGYASYRWSTGASSQAIKVKTGGPYSITVTNAAGCAGSTALNVQAFDKRPPELADRYALCAGERLTLDAGTGFQNYRWSSGETSQELTVDQGGGYEVTVTDENGCVSAREAFVEEFTIVEPVIRGQEEFCSGQRLSLFVEGPYVSYSWSTGDILSNISIAEGGSYRVSVTDANGCSTSKERSILEKPSPIIDIEGDTLFCEGESTTLSVDPAYSGYTWTNGSTSPEITVSDPGFYGIVVRAGNGCTTSDEVRVSQSPAPRTALNPEAFYCPEQSVRLDAGPGYGSYQWSDSSAEQTLEVSEPGIYQVTVTNQVGCTGSAQTIVYQLPGPRPAIETEQSYCEGTTAVLRADSNFVSFQWSTGDTSYAVEVAEPGAYEVTVVDSDGCEAGKTIFLEELAAPDFEVLGDRYFCEGASTSLDIEGIFEAYSWSTGSGSRSIQVDSAGTYAVSITNMDGCQTSANVAVKEVPKPLADAGDPGRLDCRIPLIRIGGAGSTLGARYDYQWNGPGINETNQGGITPAVSAGGDYFLQVVDTVYGCLSQPDTVFVEDLRFTPRAVIQPVGQLTCSNPSITIDASRSERRPAFVYSWEDAENQALNPTDPLRLEVETPGLYYFSIEDTLTGCGISEQVLIGADQAAPVVSAGPERQLDCENEKVRLDAAATLTGPDIVLTWVNSAGDTLRTNSPLAPVIDEAGTYILHARNERNGCLAADTTQVRLDLETPVARAGEDQQLECDFPEVILDASASSAGPSIRYEWFSAQDTGFMSSSRSVTVDEAGTYFLQITDTNNGCTAIDTVEVARNTNIPVGLQVTASPTTCFGDEDGHIEIGGVNGGEGPYLYSLNDRSFSTGQRFEGLAAGTYTLTVQDVNGCEYRSAAVVENGNNLRLDLGEDRVIKLGDSVILQALVNIPPGEIESFQWEKPDTLSNDSTMAIVVRPVLKTRYSAMVVDSNGCTAVDDVIITVLKRDQLYIPNAFSPNDDGQNDRFYIFSANELVKIKYLKIFERWGSLVYEIDNPRPNYPSDGWDGRFQGRFLNPGVFVYFLEVEFPDGTTEMFKGDVTLIR